jgi:hypothetical protein
MAIPSRQIGWSTQANLLWQISKQLERLTCVTACGCGTTTTTTTTAIPTTTTTSSSSSTTSTTSSTSSSTTTSTTTIEPTTTTTTTSNLTSIELQYFDGNMDGGDGTPCDPLREVGFLEYFTTIECVPLIVGCNLYTDGTATAYAANGYYQYGNGDYFYLFGGVVVNVNVCPQTQFFLRFDDGANVPVLDPYHVSDWNTFFNLPANGVPFYDVIVAGPSDNEITLIGGSGITLGNMLNRNNYLQEVTDITKNVIFRTVLDCFRADTILEIAKLPFAQIIANTTFFGCVMLREIELSSCLNLGDTVGDDLVFKNIVGNAIILSVPVALMTCNSGNPDGDIIYLQTGNTVTIVPI